MERLLTNSNLIVEISLDAWRLLIHHSGNDLPLFTTRTGGAIRCEPIFVQQRRLPGELLLPADIDRVVLGWSSQEGGWNLGLIFASSIAEARGSRWCGLAAWRGEDRAAAYLASESLAHIIDRPFAFISPKDAAAGMTPAALPAVEQYAPAPVPVASPVSLPTPPYQVDIWKFTQAPDGGVAFTLGSGWIRGRILRAFWYVLWATVLLALSVASLTRGIALPQPEFLPYVGLGGGIFLILLAFITIARALTRQKRITIGGAARTIQAGNREYAAEQVQGVVVSQVVSKVNTRRNQRQVQYGEINLQLRDGTFTPVLTSIRMDDKVEPSPVEQAQTALLPNSPAPNADAFLPLTPAMVQTRVQAAGLMMANALNVPVLYDRRVR